MPEGGKEGVWRGEREQSLKQETKFYGLVKQQGMSKLKEEKGRKGLRRLGEEWRNVKL
jgi:hypothetical protein